MDTSSWFARLEQTQTSYLLLATLAGTVAAAVILYQVGVMGWVLRGLGLWCGEGSGKASCSGSDRSRGLRGRNSWSSSAEFSSWAGWPAVRCLD